MQRNRTNERGRIERNAILEFVHAALSWAILGVAVAVLCVPRGGQQKQEKSRQDYSGEGMCLGMGLGVALATALDGTEHLGLGLSLGMLAGMAIGACVEKPHP